MILKFILACLLGGMIALLSACGGESFDDPQEDEQALNCGADFVGPVDTKHPAPVCPK